MATPEQLSELLKVSAEHSSESARRQILRVINHLEKNWIIPEISIPGSDVHALEDSIRLRGEPWALEPGGEREAEVFAVVR